MRQGSTLSSYSTVYCFSCDVQIEKVFLPLLFDVNLMQVYTFVFASLFGFTYLLLFK